MILQISARIRLRRYIVTDAASTEQGQCLHEFGPVSQVAKEKPAVCFQTTGFCICPRSLENQRGVWVEDP